MKSNIDQIKERFNAFYADTINASPDREDKLAKFLFSEICNDLQEKKIKSFQDWLVYYSTQTNEFDEIVKLVESYYYKALRQDLNAITLEEKIMAYNAVSLYSIEMDVDMPVGRFAGSIISIFIEIIRHYNLVLKGYLQLKGNILISDKNKSQFFSVWDAGNVKKEIPITLF